MHVILKYDTLKMKHTAALKLESVHQDQIISGASISPFPVMLSV